MDIPSVTLLEDISFKFLKILNLFFLNLILKIFNWYKNKNKKQKKQNYLYS